MADGPFHEAGFQEFCAELAASLQAESRRRSRELEALIDRINQDGEMLQAFMESPVRFMQAHRAATPYDEVIVRYDRPPAELPPAEPYQVQMRQMRCTVRSNRDRWVVSPELGCTIALDVVRSQQAPRIPCVRLCVFAGPGANVGENQGRIRRDVEIASQIWAQCRLQIFQAGYSELTDEEFRDPGFVCGSDLQPEAVRRLLQNRAGCILPFDVPVFYLGSNALAPGVSSCGSEAFQIGPNLFVPAIVLTNTATYPFNLAHELGHVLLGPAHSNDPTNLMVNGVPRATPPRLTPDQCERALRSRFVQDCAARIQLPADFA